MVVRTPAHATHRQEAPQVHPGDRRSRPRGVLTPNGANPPDNLGAGDRVRLRICRGCGCDDNHACMTVGGPCAWVLLDIETPSGICSACAELMGWDPQMLIAAGMAEEFAAHEFARAAIDGFDDEDLVARFEIGLAR